MNIEPIAIFRSPFSSKFGIPRQSGIVSELPGRIELVGAFRQPEALRGLEEYDFLWLIWGFSENVQAEKHATVRPPILGGNERRGVWATRSPFRPNNLGLSSARISKVDSDNCTIDVLGADLMDGTPIYDIKPYLPGVDAHPDATDGFVGANRQEPLAVEIAPELAAVLNESQLAALREILAQDPRPAYHDDPGRTYGLSYAGHDIHFIVENHHIKAY